MGQPWIAPDTPAQPRPAGRVSVAAATPAPRGPLRDSPVARLAPRTISSILDGGFEVLRYRFATLATVTAVIVLPLTAVPTLLAMSRWADRLDTTSNVPAAEIGIGITSNSQTALALLSSAASSLSLALVGVAVAHMVTAWLAGDDPTTREVLGFTARRGGVALVAWALALACKAASALACGLGLIITVPAFVVLSPVVAVEGIGPAASVGRSWRLTIRRRASTMIGLVLTSLGVTFGLRAIITGIGAIVASTVTGSASWSWILLGALSIGGSLVLVPLQAAWASLAYLDLRVRSEGLDLDLALRDAFAGGP